MKPNLFIGGFPCYINASVTNNLFDWYCWTRQLEGLGNKQKNYNINIYTHRLW